MPSKSLRSPVRRRLLSVLGVGMLAASGTMLIARTEIDPASGVGSDAEIVAALARSDAPTTIRVKPGRYQALTIGRRTGPVVVESVDPRRPASFAAVTIGGITDVTLRNVAIERRPGEPLRPQLVMIRNAEKVALDNVRIAGPAETERGREYGVMIRASSDVSITGSRIGGVRYGIGMLDARQIRIERNEFRDLQTDGIRGGGADGLLIAGNVLGRFTPKPREHPDGVQLWSTNQKAAARGVVIRDNLIVRDGGEVIQGIFVRDTASKLPFEGVDIRGNLILGTMFNGIAVLGAIAPIVVNNEVVGFSGQKSWIRLQRARGGEMKDNRAQQIVQLENENVRVAGNRTIQPAGTDIAGRVRAWIDSSPERRAYAGPYMNELAGSGAPAPSFTTR